MKLRARWALCFALSLACGPSTEPPLGQILLYVDTDAPLPPAPGDVLGDRDPLPLFDRVRIEVFPPGAGVPCAGCTHEFDIDRTLVNAKRASVGIVTAPFTAGYVAHIRMFRGAFVEQGEPRADATLEEWVALPRVAEDGVVPVTVLLHTDDLARPRGTLAAPLAPDVRVPDGLAGTWAGAARADCAGAPQPGEVCVPGGAFWMGNPALESEEGDDDVTVLRIVSLSPFFLGATEVTVGQFRSKGIAVPNDPMVFTTSDGAPYYPPTHCTFTATAGNDEDLPLNCVSWEQARKYCQQLGADLPTEAQFEFVAGGLQSNVYVWGQDTPSCGDAVFFRSAIDETDLKCPGQWLSAPGQGARDRLQLAGGEIVDLAGNLSEHALDLWNRETDHCWGIGVFRDPVCTTPSSAPNDDPSVHTIKGGGWVTAALPLAAAARQPGISFAKAIESGPAGGVYTPVVANTGFRCARLAAP
jgi:sulfatase modifying factor 1